MAEKKKNFIILVGGPGKFEACDRAHDQTWRNYIVPVQLLTKDELNRQKPPENISWWVYAPAYAERWADDVAYTSQKNPLKPGENLYAQRKAAVESVQKKGAKSYLDRIEQSAKETGVQFKAIYTPQEFWDGLKTFPDGSISRVWYVGHASGDGLMLKLVHTNRCEAAANPDDMVNKKDIASYKNLIGQKMAKGGTSKFYGCYTYDFADQWAKAFSVSTEGAIHKIDFSVIDRPSGTSDIGERLEESNADTDWKSVPAGGK